MYFGRVSNHSYINASNNSAQVEVSRNGSTNRQQQQILYRMLWKIPWKTCQLIGAENILKCQKIKWHSPSDGINLIFVWKWAGKGASDFFNDGLRERQHEPADTRGNKNNEIVTFLTLDKIIMFYTSLETLHRTNISDCIASWKQWQ